MRQKSILFSILIVALVLLRAHTPLAEEGIRITVSQLRNEKGHVLISLFRDGAGYPDDAAKAFRKIQVDISGKKASVLFTGLPAGNYAVAILHDENNDQKMNKTSLGLPKEGYGFSNNVVGAFGPPSWSRASFAHKQGVLTVKEIRARY
jgi:uncharacterized protein (DUF2141 family)